jgi:hypothetical protein
VKAHWKAVVGAERPEIGKNWQILHRILRTDLFNVKYVLDTIRRIQIRCVTHPCYKHIHTALTWSKFHFLSGSPARYFLLGTNCQFQREKVNSKCFVPLAFSVLLHYCFWEACPLFGVDRSEGPPTPQTPLPVLPPRQKRVPICSFINSASICILIKTWYWIVAELWGKNWDTDAHAHMTYQAPTTGLHSPTLLSFLQKPTDYLMLTQSWKFGVNCCSSGLTHPAACTRARVPLTFGHAHRLPLSPSLLKKGGNRLGLS